MRCGKLGLMLTVVVWVCGSAVMAQERDGREDRDRGDRDRRDGRGWGGPGGWGSRGPRNFTPEQREQFYNEMVDRYMERLTETYDLSPVQQMQVRQRLQQHKSKDSASAEQRAQKRQEAWEQFRKLRERREAGEEVSRDEWRAAGEQMRSAMPSLMDRDTIVDDVEKLLPAAQVEQGRERREQERAEWRERRERDRDRDRDRDGDRDSDRGDRSSRRDRDRGDRDRRSEADWRDSWQRYTDNFCRRYQLDASQQATAQSILRDLLNRRKQYEDAHQAEYAALQQIQDRDQRRQQSDTLNAPVAALFEELKTKLNQLPTTAQRAATQPAGGATSRPSGRDSFRSRDRDSDRDRDRGDRGSRDRDFN
jgi:hypothetical protein